MTNRIIREVFAAIALAALISSPSLLTTLHAQDATGGFPDLVGGLKATPGVLGVDTARTSSGKMVIFAWFENKKAVLNWYYSEMHQQLVKKYSGGHTRPSGPMTGVPDDVPVLAVASVTMSQPPAAGDDPLAATMQIAIELYTPLPGGLAAGGRFAPSSVKVPGLIEVPISPQDTKRPE
jgi:hypothetical protein